MHRTETTMVSFPLTYEVEAFEEDVVLQMPCRDDRAIRHSA